MTRRVVLVGALLLVGAVLVWLSFQGKAIKVNEPLAGATVAVGDSAQVAPVAIATDDARPESEAVDDLGCPLPMTAAERKARAEEAEREKERALAILAKSDDPEHRLAAVMMTRWRDSAMASDVLFRAGSQSEDPIRAWVAMEFCSLPGASPCDLKMLEERVIRVDENNGETWLRVAIVRLNQGRPDEAAEAVRRAITVPEFNSRKFDQVMMIERALKASSNLSFLERVVNGIGYAAAMPRPMMALTTQCEEEPGGVWLELCEQLGQRMAKDGDNFFSQSIGLGIQRLTMSNRGDAAGLARINEARENIRWSIGDIEWSKQVESLFMNDEVALGRFLDDYDAFGEAEAFSRLRTEMARLEQDPDYDQCNFAMKFILE